jgi:two-component system, OmpR family, response regulator ResD
VTARVLVVDDDPIITDVLSRYLTRAGYDVLLAHDGLSALSWWPAPSRSWWCSM